MGAVDKRWKRPDRHIRDLEALSAFSGGRGGGSVLATGVRNNAPTGVQCRRAVVGLLTVPTDAVFVITVNT
jgi:hypothetical protein